MTNQHCHNTLTGGSDSTLKYTKCKGCLPNGAFYENLRFGLVYRGLSPQQQPGSYQDGEMMMMKSVFSGGGNRSTRRKPDQEDPEEYPVENLPGNIWPIDGPKSLKFSSITTRCRYHRHAFGRRDSGVAFCPLVAQEGGCCIHRVSIYFYYSVCVCPGCLVVRMVDYGLTRIAVHFLSQFYSATKGRHLLFTR